MLGEQAEQRETSVEIIDVAVAQNLTKLHEKEPQILLNTLEEKFL